MEDFENQRFCQSCAMPLDGDELLGTNADGSKNEASAMMKDVFPKLKRWAND